MSNKFVMSVPIVKLENGQLASDVQAKALRWQRYFCEKLAGSPVSLDELSELSLDKQSRLFEQLCRCGPDRKIVLTSHQSKAMMAIGKSHRADGIDIPPRRFMHLTPFCVGVCFSFVHEVCYAY